MSLYQATEPTVQVSQLQPANGKILVLLQNLIYFAQNSIDDLNLN